MWDLLPENTLVRAEDGNTNPLGVVRQKRHITDAHTRIQCLAMYVSVTSRMHPKSVPELLAYMISIMCASRAFSGLGCAQYDAAYRRQAASTGNRRWSPINSSLYVIYFKGRAQGTPRCELCASVFHSSKDCPFSMTTEMEKTLEAMLAACTIRIGSGSAPASPGSSKVTKCAGNETKCLSCGGTHTVSGARRC